MDYKRDFNSVYPAVYTDIFNEWGTPINSLPILDLKGQMGLTHYVDFIKIDDMDHSVMRFVDKSNRPGIALRLKCIVGKNADRRVTLALFQRYTEELGQISHKWTYGWGGSKSFIETAYFDYCSMHNDNEFPFGGYVKPELLEGILDGTDPIISLI